MGGGSSKAHETFSVNPTAAADPDNEPELLGLGVDPNAKAPSHESTDDNPAQDDEGHASQAASDPWEDWKAAAMAKVYGDGDLPYPASAETPTDAVPEPAAPVEPASDTPPPDTGQPSEQSPDWSDTDIGSHIDADAPVLPVPHELPVGDPCGVPVLVGGADLTDGTATLIAYDTPTGDTQEVLVAVVDEAAEAKLTDALSVTGKTAPTPVEVDVAGRLPLDHKHELHEQVETIAKSINHHLKAGSTIPQHTHDGHAEFWTALGAAETEANTSADEAMLDHYTAAAFTLGERLHDGYATPYTEGGKVAHIGPYETTGKATVTKDLPVPPENSDSLGLLATQTRKATRIAPTIGADGEASWDGTTRHKALGTEYAVDLGDGYAAVYRPYGANDPAESEYSLRGSLEITAPAGAGHGPELVERLGQLNLVNKPMTAAEGEWTYLQRNIWAQNLANHSAVAAAQTEAAGLDDAAEHVLFTQRAHEAIGLDGSDLAVFARQLRLDAEAKALPDKVKVVRDAVATATGHPSGDALAASTGYNPTPRRRGGWLTWRRFDVDAAPAKLQAAFGKAGLRHNLTGTNLTQVLQTGVLASTERRHLMGVSGGHGKSESSDKMSGGASSVFLRVSDGPPSGCGLYWDDPTVLLSRADWYAYPTDQFGSLNPKASHSLKSQTRDPYKVATFASGTSNEVMVRNGIDLLGAEAPSRIVCHNTGQRHAVLDLLASKNISHLAGKPIDKVVTT